MQRSILFLVWSSLSQAHRVLPRNLFHLCFSADQGESAHCLRTSHPVSTILIMQHSSSFSPIKARPFHWLLTVVLWTFLQHHLGSAKCSPSSCGLSFLQHHLHHLKSAKCSPSSCGLSFNTIFTISGQPSVHHHPVDFPSNHLHHLRSARSSPSCGPSLLLIIYISQALTLILRTASPTSSSFISLPLDIVQCPVGHTSINPRCGLTEIQLPIQRGQHYDYWTVAGPDTWAFKGERNIKYRVMSTTSSKPRQGPPTPYSSLCWRNQYLWIHKPNENHPSTTRCTVTYSLRSDWFRVPALIGRTALLVYCSVRHRRSTRPWVAWPLPSRPGTTIRRDWASPSCQHRNRCFAPGHQVSHRLHNLFFCNSLPVLHTGMMHSSTLSEGVSIQV